MPSIKTRRPNRTNARRAHAPVKRVQSSARVAIRPSEAWITDPQALLAAMAAGDRAQLDAAQVTQPSRDDGEKRHTAETVAGVEPPTPPEPRPSLRAMPSLRADERYSPRFDSGVVVIIRRRPAA